MLDLHANAGSPGSLTCLALLLAADFLVDAVLTTSALLC